MSFRTEGCNTCYSLSPETHPSRLHLSFYPAAVSGPKAVTRVTAFRPETHPSRLHLSFHPAATREPDGLCGNQRYRRELLTMDIMVPETC
jgi:hypothetical protein